MVISAPAVLFVIHELRPHCRLSSKEKRHVSTWVEFNMSRGRIADPHPRKKGTFRSCWMVHSRRPVCVPHHRVASNQYIWLYVMDTVPIKVYTVPISDGTSPSLIRTGTSNMLWKTKLQRILWHARANTIYELADPYNATINVYVKLCHQFGSEDKSRGIVLQQPVCSVYHTIELPEINI